MIKIYLLDFNGAEADINYLSALPPYIENTKNEKLRRERIFSYSLLKYAYAHSFSSQMPTLLRDENGRPYFASGTVDFNLSHDAEMAALVISDDERCGVDVQLVTNSVSEDLRSKTKKRYEKNRVSEAIEALEKTDGDIIILTVSDNGKIISASDKDYVVTYESEPDFFSHWTALEAIAKADGRGLSDFEKIDLSAVSAFVRARILDKRGNTYALCACKYKKMTKT
jgi:phosphopantetheinyl transferase